MTILMELVMARVLAGYVNLSTCMVETCSKMVSNPTSKNTNSRTLLRINSSLKLLVTNLSPTALTSTLLHGLKSGSHLLECLPSEWR